RHFCTGIQYRHATHGTFYAISVKFTSHDIDVKTDILADHEFGFGQSFVKLGQYLRERYALLCRQLGRDTVYLFRIVRYIETVRFDQIILMLYQAPILVVQLPGDLDTSWPVVCICNGGIPTFGQTCCFGIEYYVHSLSLVEYQN